jgi:teichuronic acid biosynthesis glycosyltransferase TuaC
MRVATVAEYYPRPSDPAWGIWAHRQAQAVRAHDVEVRALALERPLPSLRDLGDLRAGALGDWVRRLRHPPRDTTLDGVPVRYVRFVSPPRPLSYASWGRWAGRPVGRALERLWQEWPFDLVHAHYAVPSGDAALRWLVGSRGVPLVLSVHGGDLSYTAARSTRGREVVARVLRSSAAVIANSEITRRGIEDLVGALPGLSVVHPGADLPSHEPARESSPMLVTVAHLEPHKNQAAVIRALAALRPRHPALRYILIGKGPDRDSLERLAAQLGVAERVSFLGPMEHGPALERMARCWVHVMPSVHDAFGVAHVEAMAAGLPAIGGAGTGAEDIAGAGEGMLLVPAGDETALARAIDGLIGDPAERDRLGEAARRTVAEHFTWERNGELTAAVYREALERSRS